MEYNDKIVDKWVSYGFLDGLSKNDKHKLAHGFEYMSKVLNDGRRFDSYINIVSFPVLRDILKLNSSLDFNDKFIDNLLCKLSELINSEDYNLNLNEEELIKFTKNNYDINKNTRLTIKLDCFTPFYIYRVSDNGTVEGFAKSFGITGDKFINEWCCYSDGIVRDWFKLQQDD